MRTELFEALTTPSDLPSEDETEAALATVRRRHRSRRVGGAAAAGVAVVALIGLAVTIPRSDDGGGEQIVADGPTTTAEDRSREATPASSDPEPEPEPEPTPAPSDPEPEPEPTPTTGSVAPRDETDPAWVPSGPLGPRGRTIIAWTGDELLVYGGNRGDGTGALTDGAAYSPSTDRWRALAPAPDGTGSFHGVWTGSELMVVSNSLTAFYDPISDGWRQVDAGIRPGAMTFADGAFLWNAAGVHRFQDERWSPLAPLPEGFAGDPLDPWASQLLTVDGVVTVVSIAEPVCTGRRLAQWVDGAWVELPSLELTSRSGDLADCSSANQVAVVGNRLVAWESDDLSTEVYDPATGQWVPIEPIPVLSADGATGGLQMGDDLLVPQYPASVLDAETLTWRAAVGLPGEEGRSDDMVWTGETVLMWGGACCYGTGEPLTFIDAWRWAPSTSPDG